MTYLFALNGLKETLHNLLDNVLSSFKNFQVSFSESFE